jgi:hypothetical protein
LVSRQPSENVSLYAKPRMPACFTLGLPIVTVTIGNNYRICCVTASGGRAISASSPCALFVCQVQPLSKYSAAPSPTAR